MHTFYRFLPAGICVLLLVSCSDGATTGGPLYAAPDGDTPTDGQTAPGDVLHEDTPTGQKDTAWNDPETSPDADLKDTGADAPDSAEVADTDAMPPADAGDAADAMDATDAEPADAQDVGIADPDAAADDADSGAGEPLFDLAAIADPSTAECTFTGEHTTLKGGVLITAWSVTYRSWESIDGQLVPIEIKGFAARPAAATGAIPGVVQAHGLGGYSEEAHATGTAALLGVMVLAYTGPGGGTTPENTSQGLAAGHDDGYRMFDTVTDPRGSWFWGHAVAAMRGLTCLAARPDVDPARLGITGYSAGGVATLMVAGVDPRVVAAVPLSASGAWGVAVEAPQAWQLTLLSKAGLSPQSPEWLVHQQVLDPAVLVAGTGARVMMVNGSTDEFFPLTAHVATYDGIVPDKRTSIAANFDHGCYALTGGESAATIEERAELHAKGAQRMWFGHWFGTDGAFAYVPEEPVVKVEAVGGGTLVTAAVDEGGNKLAVEDVTLWFSTDDALLFAPLSLSEAAPGSYGAAVPVAPTPNLVSFVDVTYTTFGLFPARFTLSSRPGIPAGLVPHIRNIESCQ